MGMPRFFDGIPDAVLRLLVVVVILIAGILLVRRAIPASFKDRQLQKTSTIERELAREVRYAGEESCTVCHEDEHDVKKAGYHRDISCETCHGASMAHTENPGEVNPPAPRDREFCPKCHDYNSSRPMGFPQINAVAHNPLQPCINCHAPHDPVPPSVPGECRACHGEIDRTKSVSPHVLLECTTCHTTPEEHKISPWTVKPTKPSARDFCGRCHGTDSSARDIPKVDIATHGEKYLCWQCHYPHMPEVD
jgi:DnaJ-class molecular chaperone